MNATAVLKRDAGSAVDRGHVARPKPVFLKWLWRLVASLCVFWLVGVQAAGTPSSWEMRVCADPHNFPMSSEAHPGFENRIAKILADALNARLVFVWTPRGPAMVQDHLRTGDCDLNMEVAEGTMGLLNSVPYYQAPYVFLYRKSSTFEIHSLTDPVLSKLRIGTYAYSPPFVALQDQGLLKNVSFYHPVGGPGGPDANTPLLEALSQGKVDVAVLYGPPAGYFAKQHPGVWTIVPVTPDFVPPSIQLSRIWTIGVRPGDEELRDRLSIALAQNWDAIQAVFRQFNVPLDPLQKPVVSLGGTQ